MSIASKAKYEVSEERLDAQRMLRDALVPFLERETTFKRVRGLRDTEPGYDRNLWASMANQGWLGILIPEAYGGQGLGFGEMREVVEGLGGALIPEPLTASAVLASLALLHGDNEALKQKLLPQMAAGKIIAAVAWQEGQHGTNLSFGGVRASSSGQGFVLNGSKRYVTPAVADVYIVAASDGKGNGLYCVPANAKGMERTLERRADGTFNALLKFSDTPVAADSVVASGDKAQAALARAIDEATIMASVELLAVMTAALDLTLDYLKMRVQFGVAIGSFQALQHRCVDLWIQKELSSALIDHAVLALDQNPRAEHLSELADRCKSRCSDAGFDITRDCIRLHGAIGYTDDCDIGLYLQRALVLAAWMGNGAEHRRRFDATRGSHADVNAKTESPSTADTADTADFVKLPGAPGERPKDTDWNALSDEQFRAEAAAFYERHYPKEMRYMQRRGRRSEIFDYMKTLSKYGWLTPAWPREWGGMALSPAKQVVAMEERERIGVGRVLEMGMNLLGPALMNFGTDEQKRTYLPKIMSVDNIWCQGYSEPNAGSDLASLQTSAVLDGDHYVINGSKIWTSGAMDADHMFLLARTDKEAKRQTGISFFLLDLKTPGITIRPIRNITGEEEFAQVYFDDVRIPATSIVGGLNKGWTVAKGLLGFERLGAGSPRKPQYPLNKLRELAQANGMWEDPEFRSKYTKLELDADDLAVIFQTYADVVAAGGVPGPSMSMLKIWASETTMRLTGLMIEAAGSAGGQRGELQFGDARVNVLGSFYTIFPATIAAGANDIQRNVLAKRALGLP